MVAGVVTLMLKANPDLKPKQVKDLLCKTARTNLLRLDDGSTPAAHSNEFGHGLVNAGRAVAEAMAASAGTGKLT